MLIFSFKILILTARKRHNRIRTIEDQSLIFIWPFQVFFTLERATWKVSNSEKTTFSHKLQQILSLGWVGKTNIPGYCHIHPIYSFYLRKKYASTQDGGTVLLRFLEQYQDENNFPVEGQILFDQKPFEDNLIMELNNWHFATQALLALEESIEFPLHAADAVLKRQHRNEERLHCISRVVEKLEKKPLGGLKDQMRFEQIECLEAIARLYEDMGKLEEALSLLERAQNLLDELSIPKAGQVIPLEDVALYDRTRSLLLSLFMAVARRAGRFIEAEKAGQKALQIARKTCSRVLQSDILLNLGNLYKSMDDKHKSLTCYAQALWLGKDDPEKVASIRFNSGALADNLRQFKKSIRRYHLALTYYENKGDVKLMAETYANLGHVYESQRNYKAAKSAFQNAIERYIFLGDVFNEAQTYQNIAVINHQEGQYEDCLIYLHKALKIYHSLNREELEAEIYQNLGEVYRMKALYKLSIRWSLKACELFMRLGQPLSMAIVQINLGNTYLQMNEFEFASESYYEALNFFILSGNLQKQGLVYQNLAMLDRLKGNNESCLIYLQKTAKLLIQFPEDLYQIGLLIAIANLTADHLNDRTIIEVLDPIIQNGLSSEEFEAALEIARNKYQHLAF